MCAGMNSRDFWSSNNMLEVTNGKQPWDVELTDDSNRAEQCRKRRRRFKKRNIAEKVNGTCKQVPTVNKDFICCETTQQKVYYQASIEDNSQQQFCMMMIMIMMMKYDDDVYDYEYDDDI
ncbi:hypothetical protein DPMN_161195 [Dreissena polymorpha]|uniref:Uncharacterized protein n=1 Tax=Dreissena polymorpha TaxID=45954 RepID=A0A9D4ISG1_DREPO|nr:hypothetical protein DPMN_161195 [Dreissena polymorpha]